jgi:GNAT superfamily N-acetyltransferase
VLNAERIAAAQLAGLSRRRKVVPAPPFVGLLTPGGSVYQNYAVAAEPGEPVREFGDSLEILREAFAPNPVRFELIDEASPGAVAMLEAAGLAVVGTYPLLTLDARELIMPPAPAPAGVAVRVSKTKQDAVDAQTVADVAFESEPGGEPDAPGDLVDGGSVLAEVDGRPVATAFWTAVADGVTEIAGVATIHEYRNRGLGGLVTAAAVQTAAERAGVSLAWLTPGHDGADRVYRRVGFAPEATAVHLTAR